MSFGGIRRAGRVGSTALSEELDPEELREVMILYQQLCGEVIGRYRSR
jgi:class 3 adenylate cyclase